MFKAITHTTLVIGVLCVSFTVGNTQTIHDSEGVSWERTLRIQGVIEEQDPFSESMLYDLAESQGEEIEASADNVHFEVVATHFWYALRDSLESAYEVGQINGYTVREKPNRDDIFGAGTQVTYTDLLDSLSVYLDDIEPDGFTHLQSPRFEGIELYEQYIDDLIFDAQQDGDPINIEGEEVNRFVFDLSMFKMFELEMRFRVDETGFEIIPQALLLSPAIYDDEGDFNPDNWLQGIRTDFGEGVGLYLDLTEEETINFLIETGVQYSGEQTEIPFYDLMTIFHYDFQFFAESNIRIGRAQEDFGYDLQDAYSTIMNRYVDFAYTHLYGQPPSWWQLGERGHFINGLFEPAIPDEEQDVPEFGDEPDELDDEF